MFRKYTNEGMKVTIFARKVFEIVDIDDYKSILSQYEPGSDAFIQELSSFEEQGLQFVGLTICQKLIND